MSPTMNMPRQPISGSRIGVTSGRKQHTGLPAETDIGGHARRAARRPGFGRQRHADAELAAEAEARDGAVDQQIPVALREGAQRR